MLSTVSDDQINSVNELILTELILDNTLGEFEPEEIVALLSAFVFEEKTDVEPQITPRLEEVSPPTPTLLTCRGKKSFCGWSNASTISKNDTKSSSPAKETISKPVLALD
jgi:superfamily II RNA helicase